MSNPTSNFGWVMPTSTDLVTDLPADFAVFGQGVDTTMADLKGGTSGQILSKATNTDMDFTWVSANPGDITAVNVTSPITGGGSSGDVTIGIQAGSTTQSGAVQLTDSTSSTSTTTAATPNSVKTSYDLANAAIAKSTVTTAGDIIYRNATVPTRLGIGTAGQVLAVNSGATAPEWTTASSGAMTLIGTTTLSTAAANVTFSSIPSTYQNLKILFSGRGSTSANNVDNIQIRFNSDGGSNYQSVYMGGFSSVAVSALSASYIDARYIVAAIPPDTRIGTSEMTIFNYKSTTLKKGLQFLTACYADSPCVFTGQGVWNSTTAISNIQLYLSSGNFVAGTSVSLYGWS